MPKPTTQPTSPQKPPAKAGAGTHLSLKLQPSKELERLLREGWKIVKPN